MVASVEIASSEVGDGERAPFVTYGAEAKGGFKTFSARAHKDASTERGDYNATVGNSPFAF